MKSCMSRWLDTCKRKQHQGVAASNPLAPDEVGLPFLSRFGRLFRTLIERCEYVSLNVLQNLAVVMPPAERSVSPAKRTLVTGRTGSF